MTEQRLKMYILIRADVPLGYALVAAAHASLAAYLQFQDHPDTQEWIAGPFFNTVCRATGPQFDAAKTCEDHVVITESALDGQEVALAFRPRHEWPKAFRYLTLYR